MQNLQSRLILLTFLACSFFPPIWTGHNSKIRCTVFPAQLFTNATTVNQSTAQNIHQDPIPEQMTLTVQLFLVSQKDTT